MYEPTVLCLIVEGFPPSKGQVEAAAVHQRDMQILPQLNDPRQQCLQHKGALACDDVTRWRYKSTGDSMSLHVKSKARACSTPKAHADPAIAE